MAQKARFFTCHGVQPDRAVAHVATQEQPISVHLIEVVAFNAHVVRAIDEDRSAAVDCPVASAGHFVRFEERRCENMASLFLSAFPMFVPSLSWQNDGIFTFKRDRFRTCSVGNRQVRNCHAVHWGSSVTSNLDDCTHTHSISNQRNTAGREILSQLSGLSFFFRVCPGARAPPWK